MTMNIDEIRRLLNSFYNGDISPEDVEVLKNISRARTIFLTICSWMPKSFVP